jgi:beta-phosphoglucomutase-like phosphatase (HAD superfamily)
VADLDFTTALFDVDGTLIDSNGAHAESWTQAFREHGVATQWQRSAR